MCADAGLDGSGVIQLTPPPPPRNTIPHTHASDDSNDGESEEKGDSVVLGRSPKLATTTPTRSAIKPKSKEPESLEVLPCSCCHNLQVLMIVVVIA